MLEDNVTGKGINNLVQIEALYGQMNSDSAASCLKNTYQVCSLWRIQNFLDKEAPIPKGGANLLLCHIFLENCIKTEEIGLGGGASLAHP